ILDAPCGDFFWMNKVELGVENYVGGDIVKELIEVNEVNHGGQNRRFIVLDLIRDRPPRADLVLCRDALVHFSFRDIDRAIQNLKESGSTFLLTTTFTNVTKSVDILTGDWRPL